MVIQGKLLPYPLPKWFHSNLPTNVGPRQFKLATNKPTFLFELVERTEIPLGGVPST